MLKLIEPKTIGYEPEFDKFVANAINTRFHVFIYALGERLGLDLEKFEQTAKQILMEAEIKQEP